MKIKTFIFSLLFLALSSFTLFAQNSGENLKAKNGNIATEESIKPLRVGANYGIPNILSISAEYVTPLLSNRVAPTVDFNPFKFNIEDLEINFSTIEIGANVYLNDTGKGLYGGLSYTSFNADVFNPDAEFDNDTSGPGNAEVKFNTFNAKIGAKLGRTFYFRIEVGYGFGTLPEEFITVSEDGNSTQTEPVEDVSILGESGLPQVKIGIGFGFL